MPYLIFASFIANTRTQSCKNLIFCFEKYPYKIQNFIHLKSHFYILTRIESDFGNQKDLCKKSLIGSILSVFLTIYGVFELMIICFIRLWYMYQWSLIKMVQFFTLVDAASHKLDVLIQNEILMIEVLRSFFQIFWARYHNLYGNYLYLCLNL